MKPAVIFLRLASLALTTLSPSILHAAEPLTRLNDCKFVQTDWADGDSFEIQSADGAKHTLRLYGVDCIESNVNDKTDAARLAAQRRYFGIAGFGGSPQASMDAAKTFGRLAKEDTARLLRDRPFTVHTAFADARGDGTHKRIYAFVTTADGRDLAEHLVRTGMARAFGVYRETPAGKSSREYQEFLRDAELVAAKTGAGVWAQTDWTSLPLERQQQRKEDAELELAADNPVKAPEPFTLDPNTAARDELMKLPGIGETMANRIIGARPYKDLEDLDRVEDIGPKMLERLKPYLVFPAEK